MNTSPGPGLRYAVVGTCRPARRQKVVLPSLALIFAWMSWPGRMSTAPAGPVIAAEGPGLERRPAAPVPSPAVVAGAVVVVAWIVVVVLAGLGFLGLRVSARRPHLAGLTRMATRPRRAASSAS